LPKKPFFADPIGRTFSEVYPEIEEIDFWVERTTITGKNKGSYHFTKSNIPAHLSCENPQCREGGYNIQQIIEALYHVKLTEKEDTSVCRGYEKMDSGTRSCLHAAKYKVRIKYKQSSR